MLNLQHQQLTAHNTSAYPASSIPHHVIEGNNNKNNEHLDKHKNKHKHKIFSPIDLFRYSSIRFISVAVCSLSIFIYILYYGPLMLISKLSFSPYVNAFVVNISELVTYPISYFLIERIPRQKIGYILYAISGAASFSLIFIIGNLC